MTSEHRAEIIKAYGLPSASDTEKAKTLPSLAAVFTSYSSVTIFGKEQHSSEILRHYAYTLMAQAHKLDVKIFPSEKNNNFTDWENCLQGRQNAYTCSAVLFDIMVEPLLE
ncbi:hypothetical protein [Acerihabitans arboris]|uniref:hypothetical protein n=1 Tax=Acerihabitans arboris TaxID=2691583 RepID=UPI001C49C06B|nr:hypothetical protein [Acerihabitans arboris]